MLTNQFENFIDILFAMIVLGGIGTAAYLVFCKLDKAIVNYQDLKRKKEDLESELEYLKDSIELNKAIEKLNINSGKICPNCGAAILLGATECKYCGSDIK